MVQPSSVDAALVCKEIRTSAHVIGCELLSGLSMRSFTSRWPVWRYAGRVQISANELMAPRRFLVFPIPDPADHLPMQSVTSSHPRRTGSGRALLTDHAAAAITGSR
jgi:hypothetical protein